MDDVQNIYLAKSAEMVEAGTTNSRVPLSAALQAHLSLTLARYFHQPINPDMLSVRLNCLNEERQGSDKIRTIGDECLVTCGIFSERLDRLGGVAPYIGLGRTAYLQAGLAEAAYGFQLMLDVLRHISGIPDTLEAIDMARDGSAAALRQIRAQGVALFRRPQ